MWLLRLCARHGRALLVLGLLSGFALPGIAQAMKPHLPWMVAFLIFASALRIGHRAALGNLKGARRDLTTVLGLQLALPLVAILGLWLMGWQGSLLAATMILILAGPSISGAPALTMLLGHDPAPALRLLILGTAVLPLTVLPIFLLLPSFGGPAEVFWVTVRLTAVLIACVGLAFATRHLAFPDPSAATTQALDGLTTLTLAVIVIGLMAAVGPALRQEPLVFLGWLAWACALNFGLQLAARAVGAGAATSVIAGNRNAAIFLVALPEDVIAPLLLFIGCYQVPMYLTPLVMRGIHARA